MSTISNWFKFEHNLRGALALVARNPFDCSCNGSEQPLSAQVGAQCVCVENNWPSFGCVVFIWPPGTKRAGRTQRLVSREGANRLSLVAAETSTYFARFDSIETSMAALEAAGAADSPSRW